MRNIWLLLKNYLLCGLGSFRKKDTRTKSIVGFIIITLICLVWFSLFTMSMLETAKNLVKQNLQSNVLTIGLIMSLFISVVFSLQKITGGQKANDTELLLSMPFKKIEIITAKALSRFIYNFLVVLMLFFPSFIAYLVYTPFNLAAVCGCLIVLMLIPLTSVGLSYVVDYFTTICFSNSKLGSISKAVFTLIILIGAVTIYEFVILNTDSPLMMNVVQWMIECNPVIMCLLIGAVLTIFIFGNWLNACLLKYETRTVKNKSVKINMQTTTIFRAILKNEKNRYFSSTTMMLNTLLGPIGFVAITVWLLIDRGQTLINLFGVNLGISNETVFFIVGILFGSLNMLTYPAAFSISLEGKQLWILRSMPISARTVLNAKVFFNVILITPITVISTIVIQIFLHLPLLNFISLLIIPILTNLLVSYTGVFVNLCFPKLEFESEAAVIKQSMSSFIMMLGGLFVIMVLMVLTILLANLISFTGLVLIIIGVLIVLLAISMTLTYSIGQRMFNRL